MTQPITIIAQVDEKRRIMIDLPDDVPPGKVEITVRSLAEDDLGPPPEPITREWARAKLIAAGHRSNARSSPDALELSDEERERIGRALAAGRPFAELVDEEREERF
jgi:hypothetical protein